MLLLRVHVSDCKIKSTATNCKAPQREIHAPIIRILLPRFRIIIISTRVLGIVRVGWFVGFEFLCQEWLCRCVLKKRTSQLLCDTSHQDVVLVKTSLPVVFFFLFSLTGLGGLVGRRKGAFAIQRR